MADQETLVHDSPSRSELIFISARQHVLISDNLPVRINYFDSNIIQTDSFEEDVIRSQMFTSDVIKARNVHAEH